MRQMIENYIQVQNGKLKVQNGIYVDCLTIFKIDGTFVLQRNEPEDITLIKHLMRGVYLIVVNMKDGYHFTDVFKMN